MSKCYPPGTTEPVLTGSRVCLFNYTRLYLALRALSLRFETTKEGIELKYKVEIDGEECYPLKEAADMMEIGIATLHVWMRKGKIEVKRLSPRKVFIPLREIERLKI